MENIFNLDGSTGQEDLHGMGICLAPAEMGHGRRLKPIPAPVRAIVPRVPHTPIPMNAGQVFFVAMLDGTAVPTMIAYVVNCHAEPENGLWEFLPRAIKSDFARYEHGAWHLVDSFRDLEELEVFSMLAGMRYAGLIEDTYGVMDDYAFRLIGGPESVPHTKAGYIIPNEIGDFMKAVGKSSATVGTPLFPYLVGSLRQLHGSTMTGRGDGVVESSSDASVLVSRWTGETYEQVPWHWDEYGSGLAVLVDDEGIEVLEFDEDQMLVRELPNGLPERMFVSRGHLERVAARRRGIRADADSQGQFTTLRASKADARLYVRPNDPASDRWVGHDGRYILQKANGVVILGVDANRMHIYLSDGRIAECSGDPGSIFEIAVCLSETGMGVIGDRDITGSTVPVSIESLI